MCLDKIEKFAITSDIGYKVVKQNSKGEFITPLFGSIILEPNKKLIAEITPITAESGEIYPSGFHIFVNKDDAENWKGNSQDVIPVKFGLVYTTGYQDGKKCIVAQEMTRIEGDSEIEKFIANYKHYYQYDLAKPKIINTDCIRLRFPINNTNWMIAQFKFIQSFLETFPNWCAYHDEHRVMELRRKK